MLQIDGSCGSKLFACYGTPYLKEKATFWDTLEKVIQNAQQPWLLFGDLNEVKSGGRSIWRRKLYLNHFLQQVGGIDLGFSRAKFTWQNNQDGNLFIKERLDRVVSCNKWIGIYPKAIVKHLLVDVSDHAPILINFEESELTTHCPFHFFKA